MRGFALPASSIVVLALLCACGGGGHSSVLPPGGRRAQAVQTVGPAIAQKAAITGALGATLQSAPAAGDLLVAIGFDGISSISCASGWTSIRHVSANYVDAQSCYRVVSGDTASVTPFAGTASNIAGEVWEVSGQAAGGFIDAQTGAEAGPRTVTLTFAPAHAGDLILGASAINTGLAGIVPTGFTDDGGSSPAGSTGFSDLAASEANAAAGTQSVAWAYNSTTDTHPVTAETIAIYGAGGTASSSPSPSPVPSSTPAATPTPVASAPPGGSGPGLSLVQSAVVDGSLGATLRSVPVSGDLLVAVGFNGISSVSCAAGWTPIRHVSANYVDAQSCYRIVSGDGATVTPFSGTASNIAGEIWEVTGQAASGFIDAQAGAESGPRSVTLSLTTSHAGDLLLGASAINTNLPSITPAGFASDSALSPAGGTGFSDSAAHEGGVATGTQSVTWAYNSATDSHPVTAETIAIYGNASASPAPSAAPGADWTTMGYDLQRTGYNPNEQSLGVSNVSGLHAAWAQPVSVAGVIAEPVYASGVSINGTSTNVLYVNSGNGANAIDADTGAKIWTHQIGTSSYMCGTSTYSFGSNGSAVVDRADNRLYVPDGAANVHALNLSTGAEISGWPVNIATPADHNFIYSALTYNPSNHLLYAETSSTCDISPWYGRIVAIDTTTGSIVNTFYPAQGAGGGGIWGFGGASIDPATGNVYIAVGNGDTSNGGSQTAGYSEQVVELSANLGSVLGNYYASLPVGPDNDFGATPLLFRPPGCSLLAAAVNKSGLFVLYNASNVSAGPLQTIQMSIATDAGDFIGVPAYDPVTNEVYVGLPATEGIYKPGVGAFGVQSNCTLNPTPVWNAVFGADGSLTSSDTPRSPISIANGVLYVSDYQTDETYAFNAATGAQLWSSALSGNGIVGPIVVNGRLYTADLAGKINAWEP